MFHKTDPGAGMLTVFEKRVNRYIYHARQTTCALPFSYNGNATVSDICMDLSIWGAHKEAVLLVKDMKSGEHVLETEISTTPAVLSNVIVATSCVDRYRREQDTKVLTPGRPYRFRVKLKDGCLVTRELPETMATIVPESTRFHGTWPHVSIEMKPGKPGTCGKTMVGWELTIEPPAETPIKKATIDVYRFDKNAPDRLFEASELVHSETLTNSLPKPGDHPKRIAGAWINSVAAYPGSRVKVFVTVQTGDKCTVQYSNWVDID